MMRLRSLFLVAVEVTLPALLMTGCVFGVVDEKLGPRWAVGAASDPLPPEAKLISRDEFESLYYAGLLRVSPDRKTMQDPDTVTSDSRGSLAQNLSQGPKAVSQAGFIIGRDGKKHPAIAIDPELARQGRKNSQDRYETPENQAVMQKIVTGHDKPQPAAITAPKVDACELDEGNAAVASDRSGYSTRVCAQYSPTGIYANFDWPLKAYNSCVKDQANRGTCGSFAVAAAMETMIALKLGRQVNLSEQDLYSHVKNFWHPTYYGDGMNAGETMRDMIASKYRVPYESHWRYNPSNSRVDDDNGNSYVNSCNGYDETCTNTAHQAGLYCAKIDGYLYCGFSSPVNESGMGFRITDDAELWGSGGDGAIERLKAALTQLRPVMLSLEVVPTFDAPDYNGYVKYKVEAEASRGGHIVEVSGYVSNDELRAKVPLAPLASGGGYFIAKNSWSVCYADAGFVYLPVDWVKAHAWSAVAIDGVE